MENTQQGAADNNQEKIDAIGSQPGSYWPCDTHRRLNRGLEHEHTYFRCGRFFTVGHEWYATVREGKDIGPYVTRHGAEMALACHVTTCFVRTAGHIGQIDAHGERDATMLEVLVQELASCREQARLRNENSAYVWARQRLDELNENPSKYDHAGIRESALRYFLSELDCQADAALR